MIALLGCLSSPAPPAGPDLTLVSVETLRADHLPAWGYERETMPFLSSVEGRRFHHARSTAPWTLPSMASMLTGLQATEHGVVTHDSVLPEDVRTLAEDLSAAGYEMAFFGVNELFVDPRGLDQGFSTFMGVNGWSADKLRREVEAFLENRNDNRPLFLVVHFFEPHCPYHAPRDLRGTFVSDPGERVSEEQWSTMSDCYKEDPDISKTIDAYDEELVAVDRVIGQLQLPGIVAYVGDHGESFWEHGDYGHGRQVYDEAVHVPLIVHGTGFEGVEERPVSTAWIANTFRARAGLSSERPSLESPLAQVVSQTANEGLDRSVVAEGSLRLFLDEEGARLTDLASDPVETGRIEDEAAVTRLTAALPQPLFDAERRPLEAASVERLRALGYLERE